MSASQRSRYETAGAIGVALGAIVLMVTGLLSHGGAAEGQTRTHGRTASDGGARPFASACSELLRPDDGGHFLAREDLMPPVAAVDGNDWLALVNRSPRWVLAPNYAPNDLLDLATMRPAPASTCTPPERQCLRREAALAFQRLAEAMRRAGHEPKLDSAFRGFNTQCAVFAKWAWRAGTAMGFCPATNASAIAGHSQHQLGTAVDLFTVAWVRGGAHFRDGFGCSAGGRWLAENSWRFGWVLPYPLHPDYREPGSDCLARADARGRIDPRTGYKYEPWHFRYIGIENAERFHRAWESSGPGSATEITLEQWLRERLGARDPVELPVCDGCACGACASFLPSAGPCPRAQTLLLDRGGHVQPATGIPELLSVRVERDRSALLVRAHVRVPEQTLTQPPMGDVNGIVHYEIGATVHALRAEPGRLVRNYEALEGAWRVGVELREDPVFRRYPWRVALASGGRDTTANGFNARILASSGDIEVGVRIEGVRANAQVRIGLLRGDEVVDAQDARAP